MQLEHGAIHHNHTYTTMTTTDKIKTLKKEMSEATKSMIAEAVAYAPSKEDPLNTMPERYYFWLRKFQNARRALNQELNKQRSAD